MWEQTSPLKTRLAVLLLALGSPACETAVTISNTESPDPAPSVTPVVAAPDTIAPIITSFVVPSTSASLSVSGIDIRASDNISVAGFYLGEVAATPSIDASGWILPAPTAYLFSTSGPKTLYAWAKDAAGNVSLFQSAQTTINLAGSYYISPNGTGSTCSSIAPCGISTGWAKVVGGETLILKDGIYSNASPPAGKSGTPSAEIVIRAETDGSAVISDGLTLINNAYLDFQGLKVTSPSTALIARSNGPGLVTHHVTFRRCGFNTTTTAENGGVSVLDGSHHMLFEDFWVWGGGRYAMSFYGGLGGNPANTTCDYNTLRRGVIRQGPAFSSPGNPEAGLALYYASHNVIENVIVLDGSQDSDSSNAAFYLTAHAPVTGTNGSNGNSFYGCVALNNKGTGFYLDVDNGGHGDNLLIRNSVAWDNTNGIQLYVATGATGAVVDHCTLGMTSVYETFYNYIQGTTLTNTIATLANTFGIAQSGPGTFLAQHHNNPYSNNSGAYKNTTAGAGSITTNPNLLYPIRVESGSPNHGTGSTGDIGANILKRHYDGTQTATALWPWPYEARIRKDMCTDAGVRSGFCSPISLDGSPQTLTKYIWEYLGNPIPPTVDQ